MLIPRDALSILPHVTSSLNWSSISTNRVDLCKPNAWKKEFVCYKKKKTLTSDVISLLGDDSSSRTVCDN